MAASDTNTPTFCSTFGYIASVLGNRLGPAVGVLLSIVALPVQAADLTLVEWRGLKVLKLSGEIGLGTTEEFLGLAEQAEVAAHGYPILLLDSPGGDVWEALILSEALGEAPFHTVIPDGAECASACASIVFIAGRYRTVEPFGLFGQHSCEVDGVPDPDCNELIGQHALHNGVSYGAVNAFMSYVPPDEVLWFTREDVDGWGISLYPGSETAGFETSEPLVFKIITGKDAPAQSAWRLDFWNNGWRAFNRPVSDEKRELQLNQFCHEDAPGTLFLGMEIHGDVSQLEQIVERIDLITDVFSLSSEDPLVWQVDELVSMAAITIPTEQVIPWLTEVREYKLTITVDPPYDTIAAWGTLAGSRENLVFAANHCDYSK